MIMIEGYAATFGKDEYVIDVVMSLIERYSSRYNCSPSVAKVPLATTGDEAKDILKLGPIQTIIHEYDSNLVLVGESVSEIAKRFDRIAGSGDDGD